MIRPIRTVFIGAPYERALIPRSSIRSARWPLRGTLAAPRHNGVVPPSQLASVLRSRPWASRDDTRLMQDLVRDRLERDWPAVRFHPGDIDWWVVSTYGRVPGVAGRVRLWFEDGQGDRYGPGGPGDPNAVGARLLAFGWFGPPLDLDFVIGSDEPAVVARIVSEIVAWGDERRRSLAGGPIGPLRAWASAADAAAAAALAGLGFEREDRPGFVHFTGDLAIGDDWRAAALPRGLTIRPLTFEADVAARVECGHAAFPGSTQTIERYRTVRDTWLYRPDLDYVVVTDDGRVAAFALAWLDPETRSVELEPVGVNPEWQRRGLGGEICRASLRAARSLGARRALIASDRSNPAAMALYDSLGLTITAAIVPHARPVETGPIEPAPASA
jgi:ribosomal protein S18 acetylase RimI-like enzyme